MYAERVGFTDQGYGSGRDHFCVDGGDGGSGSLVRGGGGVIVELMMCPQQWHGHASVPWCGGGADDCSGVVVWWW